MKKSFKKYEALGLPGGPNQLKRFTNGFIISERGQWDYPGQPTAVPTPTGKITTQGVEDDLVGIDNLGNMQYMTPGNEYQFQGDMVYEIPQAKKGGSKKPSKKYSRSLMAKNRLFAKNHLFEKRKHPKNKIFDPYSPYFQPGGETYNQLPSRYGDALKNFVYPEVVDSSEETGYDAALGIIKQNPNDPIANVNNPWWYEHELMHHLQNQAGGMSTYGAVGLRPNPYVASDEAIGSYYDRRGSEFQTELNRILEENPDISEEEAYARAEEDLYNNPTTTEGEARNYEGYIEAGNPSIFPKKQQDGGSLPPEVSVSYLPEGERSYYDPRIDTIYLDPNASEEELNHEMAHAWQNRQDGFRSDPYSPKLRPSTAASDEQAVTYFNRKGDDVDRYINNLKTIAPELGGHTWNKDLDRFIPEQLKYDKVIDPLMYNDPSTLEGEAEYMSQVYGRPPLGIKQDGGIILDLTEDQINEYKKGGYIVEDISVPSLTRMDDGGEKRKTKKRKNKIGHLEQIHQIDQPVIPEDIRQVIEKPEVEVNPAQERVPLMIKFSNEFQENNPYDAYYEKAAYDYLKKQKGWNEALGINKSNLPENVAKRIQNNYYKDLQDYIIKQAKNTQKDYMGKFDKKGNWKPLMGKNNTLDPLSKRPTGHGSWDNYGDGSIQMVYPEQLFMGPGAGALGLVGRAAAKGISNLAKSSLVQGTKAALNVPIANIPGATIGNAIASGFAADALVNRLPEGVTQLNNGEYIDAAGNIITGLLDVAGAGMISPIYQGAKSTASELGKFLGTEEGLLSNAYKLNPWAFKPNFQNFYRQIGKTGLEDALKSGVIRSADQSTFPKPHFVEGKDFTKLYSTGSGANGRPSVIFETSGLNKAGDPIVFPANANSSYTPWIAGESQIPISEGKLFKQDWLKGYKEVPKELPGSPNTFNFQNRFGNVDSYTPIRKYGGTAAKYGYSVGNLIRKDDGGSVSGTQGLTDDFSQRLTQFILDAKSQGIDLGVGSGYRSYEKQKKLWEQALKKYGSPEKARKWVAPPGSSFHNKGLAVDLNSNGQFLGKDANSKATEWAHANAKKYGLHFRMGHEPWHIEPIEKSKSNNENDEIYGDTPNKMSQEEYEQMIANKDLEFELKQKELEERERKLHDDDYSNWEPSKKEIVDPQEEILNAYAKIIAPSNQNLFELYNANLHGKMKRGGIVMELTDKEIDRYRKGGYIIEEIPKAQDGIQVSPSIWSDYQPKGPVIEDSTPEIEKIISQSVVKEKPLVLNNNQEKSFEEAHSEARNELGPNQIFEYNGRKFGTNNPGENFNPDEKTLEKANLNTNAVKENIYNQNKDLNDPYKSKNTVKLQEKEYEDWDKVKQKQNEINKSSNADKIIKYKSFDNSDKNYVIVDKQKGLLHVYKPGDEKPLFSAAVDLGANIGDAQTVTKVKDTNGDGIIDAQEAQIAKADFSLGNKTTGAGRYHISTIDPKGYGGLPLFNMMTDSQYEKYLKTGDINQVATSLHKGYIADDNSRVSNGCIRCNKTTLDNLVKYLENSSEVYILPEDKNNEFVYENGKINLKIKNKSNFYTYKNNGNIYKKENNNWYVAPKIGSSFTKIKEESRIKLLNKDATNAGYNFYIDSYGKVQKGQGVNKGSSLNYIPIKAKLNEEKFKNDKFTFFDFNDESELKNVKIFAKSLEDNKQKIMKAAKINGDTYNDIAKITFGIFGTESNFADTHMPHENLAKAIKKLIAPSSSSSPDYYSKYYIYGAKGDSRSVGMTQVRWNYLNDDEKKALKEVGINSNKDFMDPTKSAMGTAVVLGIRYNQQLTDTQKKDIWKYLPKKWNIRDNYADRVKSNSKYITIEQKNLKDKSIIANTNNEIYTYRGNKNAKYKKDKFGNWYINSGNKTNNQFVKINDPKGNRTKELNTYAVKLKKFIK